ncbi:hypothetical protein PHYBOEH_001012 [Phytophthora boehmeriae]|uniref:Uncharacterized protein n=1 Tax=Phytophthora boehmeriae TaxID=109152 RepID=A0A8T1X5U4_9STRA|nr:hypothetical protein PHYBOEH_001012 [Phytophthora boehmeriae]
MTSEIILQCTTLESPMKMQSCRLFWHKSTLSIILKRELSDCFPCREIPVLRITRPALFGGTVEIELGGSVHPVRMLPVSGKDVRNLRFGLVYGPKRKRVRFRAPDLITYENWEMILEVAVEKAATERPTFPVWPGQGPSPSLSADDVYDSEEFGFSDYDEDLVGFNEIKVADFRYNVGGECKADGQHNPLTGSFVDFIDPASPDDENEADHARLHSVESAYELSLDSFNQVNQNVSGKLALQVDNNNSLTKFVDQEAAQILKIDSAWIAELQPQLSSSHNTKDVVREYVTWLRGAMRRINRREEVLIIKRSE